MICTVAAGPRKGKRPRDWKEIRLTAAQALGSTQRVYAATFSEVDEVGRRWGHCARRAGWGLNSQIHALGDGAEWIRLQTTEIFGSQGTFLCDYFHVSQYLAEAAPTCRAHAPHHWRRTQQTRLKQGALGKVVEALAEHLEPSGTPEKFAPVTNAHRYLSNRTDCLDYLRALQLGLPIGSAMIESGHKHVLQARLKKSGAPGCSPTPTKSQICACFGPMANGSASGTNHPLLITPIWPLVNNFSLTKSPSSGRVQLFWLP